MKVLKIASESLKLQLLAAQLHQAEIDPIETIDLKTVGQVVAIDRPDPILVDGEILGCQVIVALRKAAAQDIPIAFLTEQDEAECEQFLNMGVAEMMTTLHGWDAVVAKIRR